MLLPVASCRRTARQRWSPATGALGPLLRISVHGIGSARTPPGKDYVRSGGTDNVRSGWKDDVRSGGCEGSPTVCAVGTGLEAGAERVGKVVSVGQVSPFASAGIGRSRAGGEDLDPVPEVVVAVESFEAIQCPAFGPVHLVP